MAAGQAEDVLGDVGQDHLLADRGDAQQAGLAEVALDVVLGGVAEAAVGLHGAVGGEEPGLGGEVLGDVGLLAARQAGVDQRRPPRAPSASAARSLAWASASGKAMPWFLPIGRPNTTRSLAYAHRPPQGGPADAERLGGDQDALGVEPVEQVVEAAALLADAVVDRHDARRRRSSRTTPRRCGPSWGSARASTPGAWRSARNSVIPSVGLAPSSSGVVRVSSRMRSASSALVVQTLRPLIT